MPQADGIVSNASGAAVRADINNQLAALFTNHSGATEPATTYAYQFWADTTAGQLKLRNSSNDDWITLIELDGTTLMEDGTVSAPGLAFADDLDTGFYRPAADSLGIATNGTNAIYIDSSQNVGIGTTSPNFNLSVKGATDSLMEVQSSSNNRIILEANSAGNNRIYARNGANGNGTLEFRTGTSTETMRIDSSGNVGIGTTSPAYSLDLGDGSSNPALANYLRINTAGDYNFALQRQSNASFSIRNDGTGAVYLNTQNSIPLVFGVSSGTSSGSITEHARLDSSGNVGIGTTSPGSYLAGARQLVISDSASTGLTIATPTSSSGTIAFADGTGAADNARGLIRYGHSDNSLQFSTNATERMRISSTGKVYIGTTSNIRGQTRERLEIGNSGGEGIVVSTDGSNYAGYLHRTLSSTTAFAQYIGYWENYSGANVGSITHNQSSTSYNTTSDYRLKENVIPLAGATERLKQLSAHRFNFIANPDKTVDGFLAHEVQTVVPEAITGEKDKVDDDGNPVYQGIDQSKLVPLLTAALQEAIAKIETLEAKVAALESA